MALSSRAHQSRTWWKESSIYQIYPSSFASSANSPRPGTGDLRGIISRLDYIASLGVDAIWLCPILASPQVDMGYDICDYRSIDRQYGTMADHDELIRECHARGLRYVMDLVVNHTSDQHEWFKRSRAGGKGEGNRYRDWYIWRPTRGRDAQGRPIAPNNWRSCFGGSVWEWDEASQEFYLHLFAKEQPDLNWENEEVRHAVHDVCRFWLEKGVDGFRMDVINFISKEAGLPSVEGKGEGLQWGDEHYACGPRLHEYFRGLGAVLREYGAFSVGEMPGVFDTAEVLRAVGQDRGELDMSFNFEIGEEFLITNPDNTPSVDLDNGDGDKFGRRDFKLANLKAVVDKWQTFMIANGGWNALYMENHDQSRTVTRYASDKTPELRALSAKMLATHLALLSGTLFVYQGQELGQVNVPREWGLEKYRDLETLNHWKELCEKYPEDKGLQERTKREYWLKSRDNARTPMQWSGAANAGFCPEGVTPWIDVHEDYKEWNAERQVKDPASPYRYWAETLGLRKREKDVFVYGGFKMLEMEHPDLFVYERVAEDGSKAAVVVTSFSEKDVEWEVEKTTFENAADSVVLANYADSPQRKVTEDGAVFTLRPFEAFVLKHS